MPRQRILIECKVRVEDETRPFHYIKKTYAKYVHVDMDVTQAAHELQENFNNLVVPQGRGDFLRQLFNSWGESMTRVMIRWLAQQWEPDPTDTVPDPHPEWEL